jgi:hypothetical protein
MGMFLQPVQLSYAHWYNPVGLERQATRLQLIYATDYCNPSTHLCGKSFDLADHLCKDSRAAPHVDSGGIVCAAQQDLWCPVPECHDLNVPTKPSQHLSCRNTAIALAIRGQLSNLQTSIMWLQ